MTTRLLPQNTTSADSPMATIERDADGFIVPTELLAQAFDLPVAQVQDAMRTGSMTSRYEVGTGADHGRWRLTFYCGPRACCFIVDENGVVLTRSAFPIRTRPPLSASSGTACARW